MQRACFLLAAACALLLLATTPASASRRSLQQLTLVDEASVLSNNSSAPVILTQSNGTAAGTANCSCPQVNNPVCAIVNSTVTNGTAYQTFSSACLADCANATMVFNGSCGLLSLASSAPTGAVFTVPEPGVECICAAVYQPVCARNKDGNLETFSNSCRARCVGAEEVSEGTCNQPQPVRVGQSG